MERRTSVRVAFLVLNHRRPAQLVRLLEALHSQLPDAPIVVHHDVFHGEFPDEVISHLDNVHLLASRKRMMWGDFSIMDVCCWSLAWMRDHLEFDWVVMLSAQDYPIKPLATLADDLSRGNADAVFSAVPLSQLTRIERIKMRHRYHFQYRSETPSWSASRPRGMRGLLRRCTRSLVVPLNLAQPLFKLYRLPDGMPYRLGWRARRTPFSGSRPCWKGSQWFAMSRNALEYVLTYLADHPEYVEFYRGTMVPDESMLATVVFNAPSLRVANRDVTYTRWRNGSEHPDLFVAADFPELMAVPQYFARKFDIDRDSHILDELDEFISQDAKTW
jgi:hypothetical protein